MDITVVFFREMRWACTENCNRKWFEEMFMCALSEQRVCLYLKGSGSVVIMCPSLSPTPGNPEPDLWFTCKGGSLGHVFSGCN